MPPKNMFKALIFYGYFIVSQSLIKWNIKTTTVVYGQNATLSCNGIGCKPVSIRKWIGGPTSDVLCFDNYSSNPAKYQLMYNKTRTSFDLMIKNFNFTDTNCTYTCACGFFQDTHMLNLDEINFVYPPDKDLISRTKEKDDKLYIDMSMKVYPLPNCTIVYKNTVLTVNPTIVKEEVEKKLYELRLEYTLNLDHTNCRENVTVSCKVRSLDFSLLQKKIDLCKDAKLYIWIILGVIFVSFFILLAIFVKKRRKRGKGRKEKRSKQNKEQILKSKKANDFQHRDREQSQLL